MGIDRTLLAGLARRPRLYGLDGTVRSLVPFLLGADAQADNALLGTSRVARGTDRPPRRQSQLGRRCRPPDSRTRRDPVVSIQS